MTQDDHMETITDRPHVVYVDEHGYHRCRDCGRVGGAPPDLPCSGTITDPALIRATDEPDERGDFPCCTTPAPSSGAGPDLGALHETICDNFTGMAEVRQAADLLVAEVRRLVKYRDWWKASSLANAEDVRRLTAICHDWRDRSESAEAEVGTLRARLAAVEDLHWKVGGACSHCSQRSDYAVAWPCETAVALAVTTGEGQ